MEHITKLFEFNIYNERGDSSSSEDSDDGVYKQKQDNSHFTIQMFGIDEEGKTTSVIVEEYQPFFYILVPDKWGQTLKNEFYNHLKAKVGRYYENSITECKLIEKKKLYGFDAGKKHRFVELKFANLPTFNKVKNFWYQNAVNDDGEKEHRLINGGYKFTDTNGKTHFVHLYEANIPPLLRFFHIREISPSGWVALPFNKTVEITGFNKKTTCDYEYVINWKHVIPLNQKETRVPYKIMSFDIEASSSHGDFPVPVKSYKKLATNIVDYFDCHDVASKDDCHDILREMIRAAFGFHELSYIDIVYPKEPIRSLEDLSVRTESWLKTKVRDRQQQSNSDEHLIERMFETMNKFAIEQSKKDEADDADDADNADNEGEEADTNREQPEEIERGFSTLKYQLEQTANQSYNNKESTIADILLDNQFNREGKINELIRSLRNNFPPLEGDKVTFIGSTLMHYGEQDPYLNHCIVLNSCDQPAVQNSQIETYDSERDVLLAWTQLVQRENPDIIIGYNIFGFDYEFMFRRALENRCEVAFLKLSRNKNEICGSRNFETGEYNIEESSVVLASGQYDLHYIKMPGRFQIDLYNYFRRDYNLPSYKLDYVASYFIGDDVKRIQFEVIDAEECTKIFSSNLTGLEAGNYIIFEETNNSTDAYKNGAKFMVKECSKSEGWFIINGREELNMTKHVRWGLAKDDVTPQDIFRMTREGPKSRAIIAKYCIQDCNLVHHLVNKIDVLTGFVEMAKICSVPMSFLVMRGQGIKLTSYIAKKCREKNTLIPDLDKTGSNEGYEGAIVLPPKCGLYLDNPVVCIDYSSLYPSCIISENLSHDSKVWTKEYDLKGNLVRETGERVETDSSRYVYDNLPGYDYVDITYDTYRWVKNARGKSEKLVNGTKVCRFAQMKDGTKSVLPSILEELLAARKATRKQAESQDDPFMANILDKRQLGYKVTANSLYGQCGAKTSTMYEVDVAAATTATGRKLLTYARRIVEEVYGNTEVDVQSKENKDQKERIRSRAEYVYGDTDSVFFTFNLQTLDGTSITGKRALEMSIELGQQVGELASRYLKAPHAWTYEKTMMPFFLLRKKGYIGMLYEKNPNKGKRKSMGIVLKRRDNAPIVKDIYGGAIDILMTQQSVDMAIDFVKASMRELVEERCLLDKLVITKSLRSNYKNPQQIAHKVLADRMGMRDPGNKPGPGDRIPFVYIHSDKKDALQGDKIETPDYITRHKIKPDYAFYITNQIMKPVQQVIALGLEKITAFRRRRENYLDAVETIKSHFCDDTVKRDKKITDLRNKEVKEIVFDEFLRICDNMKKRNQDITKFFRTSKVSK